MRKHTSEHQWRTYTVLDRQHWQSADELASKTGNHVRTVRNHVTEFVQAGIAEVLPLHKAFVYRLVPQPDVGDAAYLAQLESAGEVYGRLAASWGPGD